jgi:hypothetical protein
MTAAPSMLRSGEPMKIAISFRAAARGQIHECAVLVYNQKGVRVAIVDIRESGILPLRYESGRFKVTVQIAAMPLVDDDFSVGLYLATNRFNGNILELADFSVTTLPPSSRFVPYPREVQGFVVLTASTSLALDHVGVMAS